MRQTSNVSLFRFIKTLKFLKALKAIVSSLFLLHQLIIKDTHREKAP